MRMTVIDTFTHFGEQWSVVERDGHYFARFDFNGSLVGPYSTEEQARDFVTATAFDGGPRCVQPRRHRPTPPIVRQGG